jgi:hypothetical protein
MPSQLLLRRTTILTFAVQAICIMVQNCLGSSVEAVRRQCGGSVEIVRMQCGGSAPLIFNAYEG